MLSLRELAAIRRRLAATAPGPWKVERDVSGAPRIRTGGDHEIVIWRDFEPAGEADVEFIALARNLLEPLVEAAASGEVESIGAGELDRLEVAAQRATPAPWTPRLEDEPGQGVGSFIEVEGEDRPDMYVWRGEDFAPAADVELIANARQDVPRLVMELRRLRD